jgi:hypothetical protein
MKKPSAKARGKVVRPEPFERSKKVDFSKFKAVPSASDIAKLAWGAARPKVWSSQPPIEVLSPANTAGRGGTYIMLGTVGFWMAGPSINSPLTLRSEPLRRGTLTWSSTPDPMGSHLSPPTS